MQIIAVLVSGSMCMTHQALLKSFLKQMNNYCTCIFLYVQKGI